MLLLVFGLFVCFFRSCFCWLSLFVGGVPFAFVVVVVLLMRLLRLFAICFVFVVLLLGVCFLV